jgi:hypothetical protein
MNDADFDFIESRLQVALSVVFREFMRRFPGDAVHQLRGQLDVIPTNAELFLIRQLSFFETVVFDHYELQPELRSWHFLDIGGDGCGNVYCMVGNDPNSDALWLWEHDPPNGFVENKRCTLRNYFDHGWTLAARPDPFATRPAGGRLIARSNHPLRSMLNPITISEWRDYVLRDPDLELDEYTEVTNPFTNDKSLSARYPGRAKLTLNGVSRRIRWLAGRIEMERFPPVAPEHKQKMQQIANELGASVF